jgi:hypothetical protein
MKTRREPAETAACQSRHQGYDVSQIAEILDQPIINGLLRRIESLGQSHVFIEDVNGRPVDFLMVAYSRDPTGRTWFRNNADFDTAEFVERLISLLSNGGRIRAVSFSSMSGPLIETPAGMMPRPILEERIVVLPGDGTAHYASVAEAEEIRKLPPGIRSKTVEICSAGW